MKLKELLEIVSSDLYTLCILPEKVTFTYTNKETIDIAGCMNWEVAWARPCVYDPEDILYPDVELVIGVQRKRHEVKEVTKSNKR